MTISISTPTSNTGSIQNNSTDVLTIGSDNSVSIDTNTLHVDATNNRVGIGLTTPDAVLRVQSNATGTDFRSLSTKAGLALNFNGTGISYYDSDTTVFRKSTSGSSTELMRITSTGNVGIGTSNPATKLQIAGQLAVEGGDASIHTRGGNSWMMLSSNTGYGTSGMHLKLNNTSGAEAIFFDNNVSRLIIGTNGYTSVNGSVGNQGPVAPLTVYHNSAETFGTVLELKHSQAGNSDPVLIAFNKHTPSQKWSCGIDGGSSTTNFVWRSDGYSSGFGFIRATLTTSGAFSASSKSFKIDHPLASKTNTHHLVHMSVESPQADLIYRGKVNLVNGTATINIDNAARMSEGTFESLCNNVQCFTSNENGWTAVKGIVVGNILTITAQDNTCVDNISWMVIGERKDDNIVNGEMTDDNGRLIVEPLKDIELTEPADEAQ